MTHSATRRLRGFAIAGAVAFGLSACASDPAFLEGLAMGLDAVAVETAYGAEDTRCHRQWSVANQQWVTLCPTSYAYPDDITPPALAPPPRQHPPRPYPPRVPEPRDRPR